MKSIMTGLPFFFAQDEFRVHLEEFFRFHRQLGKEIAGFLVNSAKPGLMYGVLDPFDLFNPRFIGFGQELDDGNLVAHDQPVSAGHIDTLVEALLDRGQITEQQKRDHDREKGQDGAHFLALQVTPDQVEVFHSSGSVDKRPLFK